MKTKKVNKEKNINETDNLQISKSEKIKKSVSSLLEMPQEIILNVPLISLYGNKEVTIENYKGVVEYTQTIIRINTNCGIVRFEGKNMFLKQITVENIVITGVILKVEFMIL